MPTNSDKAQELTAIEGYDCPEEMMEEYFMDSVCPGICTNEDCEYTTTVEHDCSEGYCYFCGTQTVCSIFDLMGII